MTARLCVQLFQRGGKDGSGLDLIVLEEPLGVILYQGQGVPVLCPAAGAGGFARSSGCVIALQPGVPLHFSRKRRPVNE